MEFFSLKNKVALVTGGSRGIGASICKRLAQAGATVVINYRSNEAEAKKVLEEIKKYSPNSEILQFDVAKEGEVDKAIEGVLTRKEKIDILVNNAGISKEGLLPRGSTEDFRAVMETNLMGSFFTARAVSRAMMKNRFGRIIAVSSVIGEMGNKGQGAYAASKSALFGFAKSVARELGSRQVTFNVLCPGFIETDMTEALPGDLKTAYMNSIPLMRFGSADEVAALVHFLASDEAGYITGATIDINGGLLMN